VLAVLARIVAVEYKKSYFLCSTQSDNHENRSFPIVEQTT
jgi:hypothetical protein